MITRRLFAGGLASASFLALTSPARALPETACPAVRRMYLDSAFGQLHLRVATPDNSAGAAPPLVLLHQTALSGRMFDQFLPVMATDRIVIAVDTPGYGESDRPAERPTLAGYGDAMLDALVGKFGPKLDVLGYHTGAAIAADLASRRAEVDRVVLVSMPYFDETRRTDLLAQVGRPLSAEGEYSEDGSHLVSMWKGSFGSRADGQSLDDVARLVAEKQRAGIYGGWALHSALENDLAPTLSAIEEPVLVIAPHDGLQEQSRAAAALIPGAKIEELPEVAYGLFDAIPDRLAETVRAFLSR
ncbi:alpha/beta fold hydrolase [Altererythrobacter arenosus]|uniref:Alpha/beta fold hydrolase n=1 Tax=Altererythrobacter arenosus TaxID=3032592 RepID=A0ABY8FMS8_9SPHN|nr:alpha/beta fold hydrolase [Altererythrobacter sp. CAU 1644]WFL76332.1 alpha/beta fold hydrolase [Altererythrobacter sp. CAU 1644]